MSELLGKDVVVKGVVASYVKREDGTEMYGVRITDAITDTVTMIDTQGVTSATDAVTEPDTTIDEKAGVELDINGTPWIEGVHATTKTKTAAGIWKKLRGKDDVEVKEAEQAARGEIAATPDAPELPGLADEELPTPVSFKDVIEKYVQLVSAEKITPEQMTELYVEIGTDAKDLETNETARAAILAKLSEL